MSYGRLIIRRLNIMSKIVVLAKHVRYWPVSLEQLNFIGVVFHNVVIDQCGHRKGIFFAIPNDKISLYSGCTSVILGVPCDKYLFLIQTLDLSSFKSKIWI